MKLAKARRTVAATRTRSRTNPRFESKDGVSTRRSWLGSATLAVGVLFALFCFHKRSSAPKRVARAIETIRPGDRVLTEAPKEAIAADLVSQNLGGEKLVWDGGTGDWRFAGEAELVADKHVALDELRSGDEEFARHQFRLVTLEARVAAPNGMIDDIHIASIQPTAWIDEHRVHVGGWAPAPLDAMEMGLPDDLQAKVVDIQPCPTIRPGAGRIVLTTVNHLNSDVRELTLRDPLGTEEKLRPTATHKFYSVSRGEWLSAEELVVGETLNGMAGPIKVAAIDQLPGVHRVYNLTVQGDHVYRVARLGVLVHNNECRKNLVRFGQDPETVERLAQQAANAEANGFPHGVSTRATSTAVKGQRNALRSEVEEQFPVQQNGNDKRHHTVILPKPVTQQVADTFNQLFQYLTH